MRNSKILEKKYDLEERTFTFAKNVRDFIKTVPKTLTNLIYLKQVGRSSSSIGANYIEANESLSSKDFLHRIKISRKEAKETIFWLRLVECSEDTNKVRLQLIQEATELMNILSAIYRKKSEFQT